MRQIMREREAHYRGVYGYFEVLADRIHGTHIWKYEEKDDEGNTVEALLTERAFKAKGLGKNVPQNGFCTVDFYKETTETDEDGNTKKVLKLARRRIYKDGKIYQDIDYFHQDGSASHVFPHVHIWIRPNERLEAIEYLRHERTRYSRINFNDYYYSSYRFIIP